jgi:ligand-binding sensor domain-containing protein
LLSPDLRTLFAGTHLGLFLSEDRGLSWRLAASRFSGEDVHALAWDPRGGILYAATHGQGLLLGRDAGRRWSQANGLPGRDLHALALDPGQPRVLYVWVVGHGLFRSDDGANRWRRVAGPDALTGVESLAVHPGESGRLYAGTAKGVWVSKDGGHRWSLPAGGLAHRTAGVSVPPWRPDLLLAATLEGAFAGTADGAEWKPLPSHPSWWGLVTGFTFLSHEREVVFAVTHEGVVAAWRLAGAEWVPAAELPIGDGSLSRK